MSTVIALAGCGVRPDTGEDFARQLNDIFASCDEDCTCVLAKGTYRFSPAGGTRAAYALSNTVVMPERTLGLHLQGKKNIILDGGGARLLWNGQIQPITLDGCENITLRHFTIDWEKPLTAEGTVVGITYDYMDVEIDRTLYPCFVKDYCLYFEIGGGEASPMTYGGHTMYHASSLTVATGVADDITFTQAEYLTGNIFRLYTAKTMPKNVPFQCGDILVLRHSHRAHAGIFVDNCQNVCLEDITLHAAPGIGILCQFSENITCRRIRMAANRQIGRRLACIRDDGMQFSNCRGQIQIEGCSFHGLQDSPVNIHGTSECVYEIANSRTVICKYAEEPASTFTPVFDSWARAGDRISVIDRTTMAQIAVMTADTYEKTDNDGFRLIFTEPLPRSVLTRRKEQLALENLTNTPSVHIRQNQFGSGRSRGVMVSTPERVVVEENTFSSAGAAILIAGDASFWYESGACRDVTIRRNVFTDRCCLSPYQYSHAVISICPEIPQPLREVPYHQRIVIENNDFSTPDTPVLYAFSVDGLVFAGNRIFHGDTPAYPGTADSLCTIRYCRNALVADNAMIGPFRLPFLKKQNSTLQKNKLEKE